MNIDMKTLIIIAAGLFISLGGCAMHTTEQVTLAYEELKPGASLVLLQPIRFPANSATITIQSGEIRRGLGLDQYYPNCRLELRSPLSDPHTIKPDRFTIYKIHTNIEYVMNKPVMVAGLGFHMANDGSNDKVYSTILYLKSEHQPEVELLSCQHWEDPANFPMHLSLDQIKQTLDGFFTLEN